MPESLDPQLTARLAMQGFGEPDDPDWAAVLPWLRVAPGVCALWAAAAALGAAFVILATIPALTHFCVPSWFFRLSEHVLALPPIGGGDCPARRPRAL